MLAQIGAVEGVAGALLAQIGNREDAAAAAVLFAFADAARCRFGTPLPPIVQPERAAQVKIGAHLPGEGATEDAVRRGVELSLAQAAALAAG